ncbi:MAG: glycosyltransferase family 4 protein [Bacteroidota bacterium]
MTKKRIGIVSNTSWSIYNFRLGLILELRKQGYEVILIAPEDTFSSKLLEQGFIFCHVAMDKSGTNPLKDLWTLRKLVRVYQSNRLDFIFHYTIKPNVYGTMAAAICGIPSIAITTGLGHLTSFRNPLTSFISLVLYKIAAILTKEMWFLNSSDIGSFTSRGIVRRKKAYLLNSEGINVQHFKPLESYVPKASEKLRLLYAGRIIWDKGIKELVAAATILRRKYDNIEFQLLGFIDATDPNGVSHAQIQAWQQEGILKYKGETDDVRPFLQAASCLVFPSFYREGVSRILLEAAAMAKPIVTTDNVGCREVVQHGVNGLLTERRNIADLVAKIEQIIKMTPEERHEMGCKGRELVVRQFDEALIIQKYLETLQHYLPQHSLSLASKAGVQKKQDSC